MSARKQKLVSSAYMSLWMLVVPLMFLEIPNAMAQADDYTKLGISIGVFVTDLERQSRVDGNSGTPGTVVDLEGDLGVDSSDSVFRVDGYYRFNQKHRLDFSIFDLSRSASAMIDKDIEWNGALFPVNTTVDSDFDLAIYKLAYTWSFMHRDKGYLGLTAGLYVGEIGMTLTAEAIGEIESNDLTAPLPVIGLRGQYDFTKKLSFRASGEVFSLDYEGFDGSLYDFYAGLDYQLFKHLALGVGVNSVRLVTDAGSVRGELNIKFKWEMIDDQFWELSVFNSYDSDPVAQGAAKNAYGISTSLGWDF
jgi:hypothetical protein